jgi:3D (Asp-Asp-Asp) domain-containing protein
MRLEVKDSMQTLGSLAGFRRLAALAGHALVLVEFALSAQLVAAGPVGLRAGATVHVTATAYCQDGKTKSGAKARAGIVAADPRVLPEGSVVRVEFPRAYAGIYTVMDTGGAIDGRKLDIFIADCARAKQFGRQTLKIRVLRRGWDPKATTTSDKH